MYKNQTRKILCPICDDKMRRTKTKISYDTYRCSRCEKNCIKIDIDIRNLTNWAEHKIQKDMMQSYHIEIIKDIVIFITGRDDTANGSARVHKDGTKTQDCYTKICVVPIDNGRYNWKERKDKTIDRMMEVKEVMNRIDTIIVLWD